MELLSLELLVLEFRESFLLGIIALFPSPPPLEEPVVGEVWIKQEPQSFLHEAQPSPEVHCPSPQKR
jgi:hypothetical protein